MSSPTSLPSNSTQQKDSVLKVVIHSFQEWNPAWMLYKLVEQKRSSLVCLIEVDLMCLLTLFTNHSKLSSPKCKESPQLQMLKQIGKRTLVMSNTILEHPGLEICQTENKWQLRFSQTQVILSASIQSWWEKSEPSSISLEETAEERRLSHCFFTETPLSQDRVSFMNLCKCRIWPTILSAEQCM